MCGEIQREIMKVNFKKYNHTQTQFKSVPRRDAESSSHFLLQPAASGGSAREST